MEKNWEHIDRVCSGRITYSFFFLIDRVLIWDMDLHKVLRKFFFYFYEVFTLVQAGSVVVTYIVSLSSVELM